MAEPHVLSALKRRYGLTLDLKARGMAVEDELDHLGVVILMFAPETDLGAIQPIRVYRSREGRWTRAAVELLRTAGGPMTAKELAVAVMAEAGADPLNRRLAASIESGLYATLEKLEGHGLTAVEGRPKQWRVT